jgi:protein KTI12
VHSTVCRYCGLRLVGSTHAIVHCAADVATCAAWDAARAAGGGDSWGDGLLRDYASRFEAPNDRQRWDRPLFTVHADSELPLDDICAAMLEGKQLKPNTSTVVVAVGSSQLLHALDTKTASLIDHIISFQDTTGPIGTAALPNCSKPHPCSDVIPPASLRKLRRTFLQSVQVSPPAPKAYAPP